MLTRLSLLAVPDKALREERCRMLALLGHLLKLAQPRWGVLKAGPGGLQELAEKVKAAVRRRARDSTPVFPCQLACRCLPCRACL